MTHELYIRRCFELSLRGKGRVSPNPMVGAVLVHNGRIIGEGWHKEYGGPHAEINCLASVAEEDKHLIPQSTMYVSLEPCAHHGKTPPCADRLVQERVKEVIICNTDPHDKVAGKGIEILRKAGIAVTTGVLEREGRWLSRRFFCTMEQKRPYVILKWAQTADGFFAPLDRSRYQITTQDSMQLLHKWRTEEDAIM
ncbi:MAG: bifunctional diaminohydroxyphosphoribosylaminopyrimidine deaminase/5-amino-6-(5-phosphoribosylamino)uracil reductase RibD, partial [Taibaiella sp.]|nr:bifunctional diaminohydroxyphosphoribosylaminopyrimidine deaminase/5-amino-6-(5-phosphoribosylamino)uracil reductase RibD [Taibaiella sp.]